MKFRPPYRFLSSAFSPGKGIRAACAGRFACQGIALLRSLHNIVPHAHKVLVFMG
ncbi:hypothetical protein ACFIQG_17515 [Comamonas odontotermitis]|uniref:hypothetical protein n=1 Tax=Comamonas odontotermitis TaxID=379895 RepID=UPI00366D412B